VQTPEQIIIDGQKQIIAMLLEEIKQLKQRVQEMEQQLARFTTRKDSHNSSIPPSKMRTDPSGLIACGNHPVRNRAASRVTKAKPLK